MLALLFVALPLGFAAPSSQEDPKIALRTTPEVKVAREVQPAVVYIESSRQVLVRTYPFGQPTLREELRSGSGVVVDDRGYIITNFHVVGGGAANEDKVKVTVQFDTTVDASNSDPDKPTKWPAKLLSWSADNDLALLKVDTYLPLRTVRMGTSSDLMVGERVIAIGNPYGQRLTVSSGIISGLHRKLQVPAGSGTALVLDDLIQTDAAINQGNSGGPLLNILGEMIGINSAVNQGAENMGFAIPVDHIEEVLHDQLLSSGNSTAWYGFEVEDSGTMCINKIVPGSPAAQAGMEIGYRLLAVDGVELKSAEDFRLQRLSLQPNKATRFRVAAAEGSREFTLRGWMRVDGVIFEKLGMRVETCGLGRVQTLCVSEVNEVGPAHDLGLQPGDFLDALRTERQGVIFQFEMPWQLAQFVSLLGPGESFDVDVLRDDNGDGRIDLRQELFKGTMSVR